MSVIRSLIRLFDPEAERKGIREDLQNQVSSKPRLTPFFRYILTGSRPVSTFTGSDVNIRIKGSPLHPIKV
jgi:hypothetical protein